MLSYDQVLFEMFKKRAVTDSSKLIPGKTYYDNHGQSWKFIECISHAEMCKRCVMEYYPCDSKWLVVQLPSHSETISTHDNNMDGESYNPWLVFENEKDAQECLNQLRVTFHHERDYFDA